MTIRKQWKVIGGTMAAAVALGSTAAVAQVGNDMPAPIDLDDVVTIDEVTEAKIASLFSENPTITLAESIASVSDSADDESLDTADDEESTDSTDTPSPDSADSTDDSTDTPSPDSADSTDDSTDSPDSADTPSPDSADSTDDSADSPDSADSN